MADAGNAIYSEFTPETSFELRNRPNRLKEKLKEVDFSFVPHTLARNEWQTKAAMIKGRLRTPAEMHKVKKTDIDAEFKQRIEEFRRLSSRAAGD